jgi:hypothetical protein
MPDDRCRLGSDDVVIGLDLASAEHQAVVLTAAGQRLTRFRIPHTHGRGSRNCSGAPRRPPSAAPGVPACSPSRRPGT